MNTNIALNTRRPKFNALADRQAAMQIHGAEQAGQLNALKMGQAQQQMQRESQLRNALAGVDYSTPEGLRQAQQVHGQFGNAEDAMAIGEQMRNMDESQLNMASKRIEVASQLFNPEVVTDQASYDAAMARATSLGLSVPDGPYDPAVVQAIHSQALTAKDILSQQNADRDYELAQVGKTKELPAEVAAQRAGIARAGKSDVTVSAGEKKSDELNAQYYHDLYGNLQGKSRASEKLLMDYGLIHKLIGDSYSGAGGELAQSAKKAAKMIGLDVGDVSGPEAAAMVSNALALQLRSPEGGAGMPGAMSDRDREFLQQMVPGLATTKEGRALMIEVQKRIASRDREIAKAARDYRRKHGDLDAGFEDFIADTYIQSDLFGDLSVPGDQAAPAFEEGKVYTDANGNKAIYQNGQWVEQ